MNRPLRIVIGAVAAIVLAGVLVAPVVLSGGRSDRSCSMTLSYLGRPYTVRRTGAADVVQSLAIGVGTTHGCGSKPENVDVRSLAGVSPAAAVGLSGDQTSIYVRRGLCPHMTGRPLLACLTR